VSREVIARAPTRIDLGGGWTDVPPYCDREGGFVCNVAITRYAVATLTDVRRTASASDDTVRLTRSVNATDSRGVSAADAPLVRAALKRSGVNGVSVTLDNDFTIAAGLGGSSAASAALLGALAEWRGKPWKPAEIAEEGRRIEVEDLGVAGGRQDHYAATHGGALALTFTTKVDVRRIPLSSKTRAELASRSILVYTGQSRISGDTITAVLGAYEARERRVVDALARMRELAHEMAAALERSDLDALGGLVKEHWEHQRSLDPSIPTPRIDEIVARALRAGALGAKAMGASGGGCVLIIARPDNVAHIHDIVKSLGQVLDFSVDEDALTILRGAR
jgi:D-glycero-alpha-D-manno-heptose-7-phosphate kinase